MNHHHRKILHSLFTHPINGNISLLDVETVFKELGAEVAPARSGKIHVSLNGHSANFAHSQHSLSRDEVVQVRKFIETCGVDPEKDYPL
ncbi:MAG: hypothetical protein CMM77_00740 [Rhodospirillaceae bacterium]|nr:hypothetical protein [Magnetovibrio sp.]MAY65634.1 hypothetical protein [Rhodospirillaceae bacterium]|tara:strand:- start:391 stop:657 length:267 start_codon:yes stop_codon:yes gene_type:complete